MEQYNKFFDFILSCNDKISSDKILEPLNSLFHSFGLNNLGDGICFVFIRCCQYTEHFTISLLNEMNSKFQDQLIKTTEIIKENINKLFHEQELKINKIKENEKEKFHDINKELNILSSEVEKLRSSNNVLESIDNLHSENQEFKMFILYILDELKHLKEHNNCLSERILFLENKPPLIHY